MPISNARLPFCIAQYDIHFTCIAPRFTPIITPVFSNTSSIYDSYTMIEGLIGILIYHTLIAGLYIQITIIDDILHCIHLDNEQCVIDQRLVFDRSNS